MLSGVPSLYAAERGVLTLRQPRSSSKRSGRFKDADGHYIVHTHIQTYTPKHTSTHTHTQINTLYIHKHSP